MEQGLEPPEECKDDKEVHEPQLPIKTGMAALSRALKRKEADVQEAEQSLEGAKHWQEEAVKKVAAAEERLATLREERRKCAEQYQQAALATRKRMRTEGDERDESPIRLISRTVLRIPLSQSSTQPADSQEMWVD